MGKSNARVLTEKNKAFKPLVYICAPYSGDKERNINAAVGYAKYAYENNAIPLTPHFLFPFMNDEDIKQRKDALFMDIILLGKCQEVWVFGNEITEGMKRELEVAEKRKQAIRYFNFEGLEVKTNAKL
ncbi:DUF4406 domain-containing protein [Eubacteriales bacterium KG125]